MEPTIATPARPPEASPAAQQVRRIVALYAAFSTLWILTSDQLLEALIDDRAYLTLVNTLKGWLFVAVTTLLLYRQLCGMVAKLHLSMTRSQAVAAERQHMRDLIEAIVANSTDAIYAKDTSSRYILFNPSAAAICGLPAERILGQDDRAIFPPDQAAAIQAGDRQVLAQDSPLTVREELDTAGGRRVFLTTKEPLHDPRGRVVGIFGITRDVTARDRHDEAARRWMMTFKDAAFGLAHVNARDNTFIEVNETFARQRGYAPEELKGRPVTDLYAPRDRVAAQAYMRRADEAGHLVFETVHVRKDGSGFPVMVEIATVRDTSGTVVARVAHAIDISARVATEASLRVLTQAIEQCAESIVITDAHGRIEYVNDAFVRSTGYPREEAIGRNPSLLKSGKTPGETYVAMWDALGRGNSWKGTFYNRRRDGSEFIEFALISPVRQADGRITHYLGVKDDITEKTRNAEQLALYRAHLEEMVANRTAELELAKREAETANLAKSAFLATMSHEIRTPMNGVIGMVDILRCSSLSPDQMELTDTIRESAFSLLGIIDDILDFSKIEAGRLELERVPLAVESLAESVCDALRPLAQSRQVGLALQVDPALPARILSDPLRLRQILTNLVSNAIKFSAAPDHPGRVLVRVRARGMARMRIVVADNGIGMSAEVVSRLFTPFSQGESSTTRRFGGTGLGLSICRRLTDLFGGDIRVRSQSGKGSVFALTLPITPASGAAGLPVVCNLRGLHCIIATREHLQARDWARYLRHSGAMVQICPDLDTALREAVSNTVLILPEEIQAEQIATLRSVAPARDIRLVSLGRNGWRYPRALDQDLVALDAGELRGTSLVSAVALAAGRIRPDEADAPVITTGAQTSPPSDAQAAMPGQLILVAEDDHISQKVIKQQLTLLGFGCELAGDGAEALRRWRGGSYALLLTDVHMPQMDGYALTASIRAAEGAARHMPIIALSANALSGEAARCKAAGMDDYLAKPVQIELLQRMLRRWIPAAAPPGASRVGMGDDRPAAESVLDTRILARLIGDDQDLIREFLQEFMAVAAKAADEIGAGQCAGDWDKVGATAHRLKSASRSVGALPLGVACQQLAAACAAHDGKRASRLAREFAGVLAQTLAAVERHLDHR